MPRRFVVLVTVSCLLAAACGPTVMPPRSPVPDSFSSFLVWTPIEITKTRGANGEALDSLQLRGGEIVRLELLASGASQIELGERFGSGPTAAELWTTQTPMNGAIIARVTPGAAALILPTGTIARAYLGHGSDPGYFIFDLEQRALDWANGPLPRAFPLVAPRSRVDFDRIEELDRVLAKIVARAPERTAATEQARAIRRVVGLRVIRALRSASGYPYFFDSVPDVLTEAPRDSDGSWSLAPKKPVESVVEGPGELLIFPSANLIDTSGELVVAVLEEDRERGRTFFISPHPDRQEAERAPLRRIVVHVPPGSHRYRIEASGGEAGVRLLLARPVIHAEDALSGQEDEGRQLTLASAACTRQESPPICALVLALLGADRPAARGAAQGTLDFRSASAASSAEVQRLAEELARGGPREPASDLEWAASHGDRPALRALAAMAGESVDDSGRRAWVRARARGSHLVAADTGAGKGTWTVLRQTGNRDANGAACAARTESGWPELTSQIASIAATTWHGTNVVEILALASSGKTSVVELEVDGERLTATPSARLSRWHVRVRGTSAAVRRLDAGATHLYALTKSLAACGVRFQYVNALQLTRVPTPLSFAPHALEAGIEVWLRDGVPSAEVQLTRPGSGTARIVVRGASGISLVGADGARFSRVARLPLPDWARDGVLVSGDESLALRPLVASARAVSEANEPPSSTSPPAAEPLDDDAVLALSRQIRASAPADRAALYLQRALLLANSGAARAATEDARRAASAVAPDASGATVERTVQAALRARHAEVAELPETVRAYGIEPDFDPVGQVASVPSTGPRSLFAQAENIRRAEREGPEAGAHFDLERSARMLQAAQAAPLDPRSAHLSARALRASRWHSIVDLGSAEQRITDEYVEPNEALLDPDGELRPSALAGQPFVAGTFATVTADHPARARVGGSSTGARGRVDLVCMPREPGPSGAPRCPLHVLLGDIELPLPQAAADDGGMQIPWSTSPRRSSVLRINIDATPARYFALARIVFDEHAAGTVLEPGTGFVLAPKRVRHRYRVVPDTPLSIPLAASAILRLDAVALGNEPASVVVHHGAQLREVAADGSLVVLPVLGGGPVEIEVRGGAVSLGVAERVGRTSASTPAREPVDDTPIATATHEDRAAHLLLTQEPPSQRASGFWREAALQSPEPLTPLQASLGTTVVALGTVYGTMRQGKPSSSAPDAYAFAIAGYRRRIESIGLWTDAEVFGRARDGEPTYGGTLSAYEELSQLHLRLAAELGLAAQRIDRAVVETWKPHAFVEYSLRVTRNFFVLPRLGYDGDYSAKSVVPRDLALIDDGVYNLYRVKHPTFLFAQALLWFAPHFNDIFYLRTRATLDPNANRLDHVAFRPGLFTAVGQLDLSLFVEAIWRGPTQAAASRASQESSLGTVVTYDFWSAFGSFDLQPGAALFARTNDATWQINFFVNVLASYRRGLRDFSSLTLDFPEQLSGGIPWRGATPGGYR